MCIRDSHWAPNGGHGSFCPADKRWLSCVLVLANSAGYVMAISTAPAVLPAMMDRNGLGFSLLVDVAGARAPMLGTVAVPDMVSETVGVTGQLSLTVMAMSWSSG